MEERINVLSTAFERFQDEHLDLITRHPPQETKERYAEFEEFYVDTEKMIIKTVAKMRKLANNQTNRELTNASTSAGGGAVKKTGKSEYERAMCERELNMEKLRDIIMQQQIQLEERADDVNKNEKSVLEMHERVEREPSECSGRKNVISKKEKELNEIAERLREKEDLINEKQESAKVEQQEHQERLISKEKALEILERQLKEQSERLEQSEPESLSTSPQGSDSEVELPRFSGKFNEFPLWKQQFKSLVHNTDISQSQKLVKLLNAQPSIIEKQVHAWLDRGHDYNKIYETLDQTLQAKCLYVYMLLDSFELHTTNNQSKGSSVRHLIERANLVLQFLEPLANETDNFEALIVAKLILSMPHSVRAEERNINVIFCSFVITLHEANFRKFICLL